MQVTVDIPDEMALRLISGGSDPERTALESIAIEGYRSGALTASQTRRLLCFETRYETDGLLNAHNVWERADILEDLEQDRRAVSKGKDPRKFTSHEEMQAETYRYWHSRPDSEIFEAIWEMSRDAYREYYRLKGIVPNGEGSTQSLTRIQRATS